MKDFVELAYKKADEEYQQWLGSGEGYEDWRMNSLHEAQFQVKHLSIMLGRLQNKYSLLIDTHKINIKAAYDTVTDAEQWMEEVSSE